MRLVPPLLLLLGLLSFAAWAGPLHRAAASGDLDAVKAALQVAGDVNVTDRRGMTAMHWAAVNGHLKPIKYLLRKGGDPELRNRDGLTVQQLAARRHQAEVVQLIDDWYVGNLDEDDEDCE